MENECTSHNFSLLAIFLPKIIKFGGNLTKYRQIKSCLAFLRHGVYSSQHSHRCLLQFKNTRSDSILSHIRALCGLVKRPLWLNTRSTGAEVAGVQKILSKRLCRTVNCDSHAAQLSTGQRDDKIARIFTLFGTKPKTRTGNIFQRPRPRPRTWHPRQRPRSRT